MHRKLNAFEIDMLDMLSAKPTINSGATFEDGDGVIETPEGLTRYNYKSVMVEVKSTEKKSFSITQKIMRKLQQQADQLFRMPILAINFANKDGGRYVIMTADDFRSLIAQVENLKWTSHR